MNSRSLSLRSSPYQISRAQDLLLRATLERVRSRHPYYRQLYASTGVDVTAVTAVDQLDRLPLTTKEMFAGASEDYRLTPTAAPEDLLWDIAYTSGSTSAPTPIYQTAYDFHALLLAQTRMAQVRGMTSRDRIANLYPLTPQPHGAWTRTNHAAAAIGAYVVCGLSGAGAGWFDVSRRLSEVSALLVASSPTVLWGVPSYIRRVVDEVIATDGHLLDVRMLAVSGEPCTSQMTALLVETLARAGSPDVVISNSLGASEMQCGLVECTPGGGFHNPAPELFHIDAVDDRGRAVPNHEAGRLCLTHLDRRGTLLMRYLLGDVVTIDRGRCPHCERSGGRVVAHHGREGGSVKVRGQLMDPRLLERAILDVAGVAEHRAVVRKKAPDDPLSPDELVVLVAAAQGSDPARLSRDVTVAAKAAVRITPQVEIVGVDQVIHPDERMKPKRFSDERRTAPPEASHEH